MLNYVWIGLIIIGILVAVGNDVKDEAGNTYRNGLTLEATLAVQRAPSAERSSWEGELIVPAETFNQFYGIAAATTEIRQPVSMTTAPNGASSLLLTVDGNTPERWREMAKNATTKDKLTGNVKSIRFAEGGQTAAVQIVFEPIRFVKVKAVTQ
ncbi:MAG: hypothetical protein WEB62_11160, partial [Bacteroidota bacterium]